jgi:hypothetical protein
LPAGAPELIQKSISGVSDRDSSESVRVSLPPLSINYISFLGKREVSVALVYSS